MCGSDITDMIAVRDVQRSLTHPKKFLSERETRYRTDPLQAGFSEMSSQNPLTDWQYRDTMDLMEDDDPGILPSRPAQRVEETDPAEEQRVRREDLLRRSLMNQGYSGTRRTGPLGTEQPPETRRKRLLGG